MEDENNFRVGCEFFQVLEKNYGFDSIIKFNTPDSGGFENTNLIIETLNSKYVVRICEDEGKNLKGSREYLEIEIQLISLMRKGGLKVPQIIKTKAGEEILHLQKIEELPEHEEFNIVAFAFCSGSHMEYCNGLREIWQTKQLGHFMGKFHSVIQETHFLPSNIEIRFPIDPQFIFDNLQERLPRYTAEVSQLNGNRIKLFGDFYKASLPIFNEKK